jgi:hypothetical protein
MDVLVVALLLIPLIGPDEQTIWVNPAEVVSIRTPRGTGDLHEDIQCVLTTADGKFISLTDLCSVVSQKLNGEITTEVPPAPPKVAAPVAAPVVVHTTVHQPVKVITKTKVITRCEPSLIPFRTCQPSGRRRR